MIASQLEWSRKFLIQRLRVVLDERHISSVAQDGVF
jgi:hypothetical protein